MGLAPLPEGWAQRPSSICWCWNGICRHKPAEPGSFHSLGKGFLAGLVSFLLPGFSKVATPWFSIFRTYSANGPGPISHNHLCMAGTAILRLLAGWVTYLPLALLFSIHNRTTASHSYELFMQVFCRKKTVPGLLLAPPWMAAGLNYKE